MRYLVTGCAGFIASHVSLHLLRAGHEVVGVDNLNDAYDVRLKEWRLARLREWTPFEFHRGDISRMEEVEDLLKGSEVEGILNLAARAGVRQSMVDPWAYLETNAKGSLNILELARRKDVAKVVTASTSSLYGKHNPRPFREDADTSRPLSPYAASKKAAESMAAAYAHLYRINTPVCRYFTVFGPAGRPDMSIFRFIRWISEGEPLTLFGDGLQERDFTYVDDIARGTLLALEKTEGHEVYNLGSDNPVRLADVISLIEKLVGRTAVVHRRPMHVADIPASWADITKAKSQLGWTPLVPFHEGLTEAVKWYADNRELVRNLRMED